MIIGKRLGEDRFKFYKTVLAGNTDQLLFDEEFNAWFVFNVRNLHTLIRDERLKANTKTVIDKLPLKIETIRTLKNFYSNWVMFTDGESHKQLRRLVGTIINTRYHAINYTWPQINKNCDFTTEYARPYVYGILAQLVGVSVEDISRMVSASETINSFLLRERLTLDDIEQVAHSIEYAYQVVKEIEDKHVGEPLYIGNELLDLPQETRYPLIINLVTDGFAPFVAALDFLAFNLLTHPYLEEELNAKAGQISLESLRLFPPFTTISRTCVHEIPFKEKIIRPRQLVIFDLYSINRDPEVFPDPEKFNLENTARAYSFGAAQHLCSGNPLVRKALEQVTRQSESLYKYKIQSYCFKNSYGFTDMNLSIELK
ncbi:cytochrome P450 [Bifidobacterium longum]|uniref:Biotin biosynthesis cytochrome P450 n=3 Tax=Bacillati TaxID=1783272 RepID=A0ABM9R7B5_BIFLI|nr:cytochrome P450 [Bifidobacterium longum]ACJ53216.1 Cytochrome P450-like protein [Bifidobacterium longum subsp. infantis ATCC 15697 = JCM 1222 = DSM 20088]MBX4250123.1 cytochrome P450 [Bifidobacterium longum subsp. infantis]MEE4091490.1 cytochrome P450 [Bifidobacterium longum subsp. infantis]CEF01404.1 Biotin biosynthesis cytochrome P450 [Bifidobacterium longum subsp. infantis]CEF05040.1 Biotin biosynthesis cytochrome P450 [Bifidobacterium longum subsp. infantis]